MPNAAVAVAAAEPRPGAVTMSAADTDDGYGFLPVETLRKQYIDYLTVKAPEIEEQKLSRRYYHAAQWDAVDIEILRRRRQPIVTYNRTARKINGIVGLVQRVRQDAKAFPRTPNHEQGAEIATMVVREVLDASDWKTRESNCVLQAAIEGIAGVELRLVPGDTGDPDIELHDVFGDDYFYDPRSARFDFSDARFEGVAKWIDEDEAIELFPDKAELISSLIGNGSDLTTQADREFKWVLSVERRIRLVEHWYRHRGQVCWAFYISNVLLDQGKTPFFDEKNRPTSRFIMMSAAVDHDGDRYGFVRNLKGPQDEVNQRRSKGLHISNSRRLIADKGAVDDVEIARREWARPDGFIEKNKGFDLTPDETSTELAAQFQWLEEAKNEIEQYANVNVAALSQGTLQNLSGRAINLLQQPGLAELAPFILSVRSWKQRVARAAWLAAQRHWTAERLIRVTDDGKIAGFLHVNGLDVDEYGRPALVNALGQLDVDIILDEGPDIVNLMQDTYDVLRNQPPGVVPPQVLIELSPIPGSQKQKILQMLQPPPPDPADVAAKQLTLAGIAAQIQNMYAEIENLKASATGKRAKAVSDVMAAAEHASKAGLNAMQAEQIGMQTAPIVPAEPTLSVGPGPMTEPPAWSLDGMMMPEPPPLPQPMPPLPDLPFQP